MKLLFLCKRRPQGRDLLIRPYGRFYHLPLLLARQGHEVTILLCSYKGEPDHHDVHDEDGIRWYSISLAGLNPLRYYRTARQLAREIGPDWIIGFSDTWYGIMASHLAPLFGCRSLIDAYDNYESYMAWCKPLHHLWRRSLAEADMVTAAGPQLAELMARNRKAKPSRVMPMAADPIFKPLNQAKCREKLGLPLDKKMLGYCGAIYSNRGIEVLFDAYRTLARQGSDIELVLSGRKAPNVDIPVGARWLGYLPDEQMPLLLNSMDLLTVLSQVSSFGNFSYPVKLYEAMRCRVPVVATATQTAEWIMRDHPEHLVPPGDSQALTEKISYLLQKSGKIDYGIDEGWEESSLVLEEALRIETKPPA